MYLNVENGRFLYNCTCSCIPLTFYAGKSDFSLHLYKGKFHDCWILFIFHFPFSFLSVGKLNESYFSRSHSLDRYICILCVWWTFLHFTTHTVSWPGILVCHRTLSHTVKSFLIITEVFPFWPRFLENLSLLFFLISWKLMRVMIVLGLECCDRLCGVFLAIYV
jgi:hypothetical protein